MKFNFKNIICLCVYATSNVFLLVSCSQGNNATLIINTSSKDTSAVVALLNKADSFKLNNNDSFFYYSTAALQASEAIGFKAGIAKSTKNKASYYQTKGEYDKSLVLFFKAINLFDSLDLTEDMIRTEVKVADTYKRMGGEKGTTEYLNKGLSLAIQAEKHAQKENLVSCIAESENEQAIILRDLSAAPGKEALLDSAFLLYKKAILLLEQSSDKNKLLAKLCNNISQVYIERLKDYPKAEDALNKAITLNEKNNDLNGITFNYANISNLYLAKGDLPKAKEYALKMLALSAALNEPHRLLNAYEHNIIINKQLKLYDSALYYTELRDAISDSLTNTTKTAQVADMQTKYETGKKEAQIDQLNKEGEIQNRRTAWAIGVGLVLLLALSITAWFYRRQQKQKALIAEQSARLQWMMKELHHRVKNNLQIVSSLLNLQSYRLKDGETIAALKESQLRVQAMSLIHQRLYQAEDVSLVNFKLYISDLIETLMNAYGYTADDFDLDINIDTELLDVDTVLPMGLMVNEIITNSFKYAFNKEDRPLLRIQLHNNNQQLQLEIADNGPGMLIENNKYQSKGFGKNLIDALVKQLRANYTLSGINGTSYIFTIPYNKEKVA